MRIDVRFSVEGLHDADLPGATAVVIDVLRATTSMVQGLASGARAIYPTASTEEAVKLLQSIGRDDTLLCGEHRAKMIEGYHLGNSPAEFTAEVVEGKRLIMNTTNGTRAFLAAEGADRVIAGAFRNLGAVTVAVAGVERLVVACAGRSGAFALEDALCAGHLIRRLRAATGEPLDLGDGAMAAEALTDSFPVLESLTATAAGRDLAEAGLAADVADCARFDVHPVVPELVDRVIRLRHGG